MFKKILLITLFFVFISSLTYAKKTTYVATNHRLNYVKIQEVKTDVAELRQMSHPKEIQEEKIRKALSSIKLSKQHMIGTELDILDVFNERAINFLTPALVRAFSQAKPNEQIVFSYLVKDPYFILRNDRISIAESWISEDKLNIKFKKLYAKVVKDIDKKGNYSKAVASARGLRLAFDLQEGQTMGIDDPSVLIIDLAYAVENKEDKVVEKDLDKKKSIKTSNKLEIVTPELTIEKRLEKLEELKNKNLITNKEYKEKKKEILKDL